MTSNAARMPSTLTAQRIPWWEILSVLMLMLMDLSWITPTYSFLVGWSLGGSKVTAFLVFGVIYLASYMVASIHKLEDKFIGMLQVVLLAVLLLGLIWAAGALIYFDEQWAFTPTMSRYVSNLISFSIPPKPELLLSLAVFLTWRRGISNANRNIGLGLIRNSFRIGSLMLVGLGVITSIFGHNLPFVEGLLFLFTSLIAMGAARLSTLSSMRGSKRVAFKREWVVGLTVMAGLVLTLSVGIGIFAAGPFLAWVGKFIMGVEGYIFNLLKIVLAPVIHILGIIFAWFWGLFVPYQEQEVDLTAVDALGEGLSGPIAEIQELGMNPQITSFLSTLGTVIAVLIIVGIVLYTVRRFRSDSMARKPGAEDQISIAGSLSDYLRSVQNRARQAFVGMARLNPAARFIAAARVRIIYGRLLKLSAQLGEPRGPAVTPIEFVDSLEKIFTSSRDELEIITHAYLRVRYGELPETRSQVEEVESAWRVVRDRA
ncbi:MAG: DUF4129 domain-containing protein [Anaerolineales bacterium]|nr:MAG: DUF4129 domain-containing protein [Anaerolineales bacterium]